MPKRVQRRRTAGWRAPEGAKYVGRGTRYGNPFAVVRQADGMLAIPAAEKNRSWPTFTYEHDARTEASGGQVFPAIRRLRRRISNSIHHAGSIRFSRLPCTRYRASLRAVRRTSHFETSGAESCWGFPAVRMWPR